MYSVQSVLFSLIIKNKYGIFKLAKKILKYINLKMNQKFQILDIKVCLGISGTPVRTIMGPT